MKKFFIGALTALMFWSFGAFATSQAETEDLCCGGYYCYSDCDDSSGDYCGRYGCRR